MERMNSVWVESLYSKPLVGVCDGDDPIIVFAPGLLDEGLRYLMTGAYTGDFPNDFFVSREMGSWIGRVNNERGHRFKDEMTSKITEGG